MKRIPAAVRGALVAAACVAPAFAFATNGYFSHGYGLKAKGMAGASIAVAQDAFGGANNPAAMVFAGTRMDVGLDWFSPRRRVQREESGGGMLDVNVDSDSTNFFIPEFAYNRMMSPSWSLGVTVYGNGGMNTDFPGGQLNCTPMGGPPEANALCGLGSLGVDLSQLIIAPTVAYKLAPQHSVGIAPLLAYQRFEMNGAHLFTQLSQSPGDVTNKGYDSAFGYGVRVGYMGRLTESFAIGAVYANKTRMEAFDKYQGLFAGNGDFDIPEHYGIGVAFQPTPALLIAADYLRINYSEVASVGNPSTNQAPLGSSNGPGFGWQDTDVYKIGVQWKYDERLTLRAGYNRGDNPIMPRDVTFNILAPGVVKDHYTFGLTWAIDKTQEITFAYMHAKTNSVEGSSFFNAFAPGAGGKETISMYQNAFGVAWGRTW